MAAMTDDTGPAARPRQGGDSATRDDILLAAATLIVRHGYGACTMRAISDAVNIKAGSLYYHFTGKQQIVLEIMSKGVGMMQDAVQQALADLPPAAPFDQRLRVAVMAHVRSKASRDKPFMQVYEHLTPAIRREGAERRRKYTQLWLDLFEDGMRRGAIRPTLDRAHVVTYLLSSLNRAPEWYNPDHMTLEAATDLVMDLLMRGVFSPAAAATA